MTKGKAIPDYYGRGDVYALIVSALAKMSKPLEGLTMEDLAPVDHFHPRGFTPRLSSQIVSLSRPASISSTSAAALAALRVISRNGFNAR